MVILNCSTTKIKGECPVCGKDLGKEIYAHLFPVHDYTKDEIRRLQQARRVLTNFNDSIGPKRARNSCPKCACGEDEFTFENVTFPDKTAFEDWKRKFEDDNITRSSNREDIPNSHYHIYAM
ncbi:hypothetical protein Y032_0126g1359 [Ancylostoma ceylanicum]|uniref:C2H2-type domain-containing protein n=1 Tax=Ancylostoma ceylanicum TaxID=53326 RepID=A0A016T8R5_9BILA|nr:hypothetical protein Y032_0126g1359 [Ancylostoma ceylanicum]